MAAKRRTAYPTGQEPDLWNPDPEDPSHRFALGRVGPPSAAVNPLVVIAMNPSYADRTESDRTVNTIIAASSQLGHDGWVMLNLYPERATSPSALRPFDIDVWRRNWAAIEEVLDRFAVTEVLGAWGNPPHRTIRQSAALTLPALRSRGTRVYCFGSLTAAGSPRHPTPRGAPWSVSGAKLYLD